MLLVDSLLIGGIRFCLDKVLTAVDRELNDDSVLREELIAAQMRFELGEISAEDWLGMVAVIQRYQKDAGAVTQRGFNYDWVGSEEGASLALTVNVRNGRSRIRLESNRWMGIFMVSVFCPVFALVFSLSLSKHSYPLAAVSVCLLFGALWFGIVRQFGQHHVQSISGLMERLADEVRSESTALRLESSTQAENQPASREETVRL